MVTVTAGLSAGSETSPDPTDELISDVFARDCLSRATLEDVAGKWGILALLALGEGELRFNALRRRVQGVSEKMLSQTLQTLERDGMLSRDVITTIPPRVQYSLTPLGERVAQQLRGLAELLEGSVDEVGAARAAYDARALTG
ncbi:DNA-binding HxlR family transcriptional regulator [Allocatelliglobosispora scoriae]|uniref:DNA-binding HxlR family transcriptional regulator n=1 Tax=Allocatelliglobosispora scoriae TaxID=643052 RepID=A0A841C0S6_9ACTN|nr:helix-turn-helix domain-containing protein [Allocatelliglobosispora scoriae]MBB5873535.1 DNA-binding HxlR family transcriptional regulator [Allocatelliglobosispora scoriae]